MNIYTIGFTKKSAEQFFTILKDNKISKICDVRLKGHIQNTRGKRHTKGRGLLFM